MNYSKLLLRVLAVKDAVKALEEELRERIAEKAPRKYAAPYAPANCAMMVFALFAFGKE